MIIAILNVCWIIEQQASELGTLFCIYFLVWCYKDPVTFWDAEEGDSNVSGQPGDLVTFFICNSVCGPWVQCPEWPTPDQTKSNQKSWEDTYSPFGNERNLGKVGWLGPTHLGRPEGVPNPIPLALRAWTILSSSAHLKRVCLLALSSPPWNCVTRRSHAATGHLKCA